MPHNESYVLASYLLTFVALIVIIGWVMLDSRARQNELRRLEAAGIRRRSAGKSPDGALEGPVASSVESKIHE
jgi:heme exporter protein D